MRFANRSDAGRRLAAALMEFRGRRPAVMAVPRGGVVVGLEVARELGGELCAVAVKKVPAPFNPELAVGAVAADGTQVINQEAVGAFGIGQEELRLAIDQALAEARRRQAAYPCRLPELAGRPAIVVDDGLATGYTAIAAVRYLRRLGAQELVVAVPVAARASARLVAAECHRLVALTLPEDMEAVGQFYDDFSPTADEEVQAILQGFAPPEAAGRQG